MAWCAASKGTSGLSANPEFKRTPNSRRRSIYNYAERGCFMARYKTVITWSRDGASFTDSRYSRGHRWLFDGGIEVPASSSPHFVPLPFSVAAAVDPEEAFVVSLSSCRMLWFLSIVAERGFIVDCYGDEVVGVMGKNASSKLAITRVTLRP